MEAIRRRIQQEQSKAPQKFGGMQQVKPQAKFSDPAGSPFRRMDLDEEQMRRP